MKTVFCFNINIIYWHILCSCKNPYLEHYVMLCITFLHGHKNKIWVIDLLNCRRFNLCSSELLVGGVQYQTKPETLSYLSFWVIWVTTKLRSLTHYPLGTSQWKLPSQKSHNASDKSPIMQHFVTEMCTLVRISVTKCCILVIVVLNNGWWKINGGPGNGLVLSGNKAIARDDQVLRTNMTSAGHNGLKLVLSRVLYYTDGI